MSPRKARTVVAGLAVGFGIALAFAPAGWAEPATPTTPAVPSETSTTDELTDMVLDALEQGPATSTAPAPRPAQ
ncbi:hypothetical protein [Mycolicibacterium wolinskyi]|uniref:hypothetical protein n=1 Tax=Mycolicibacterium wolinskyi TaxID=59750 RepID=UPI000B1D4B5F|nr:hypothetical protein [Mycolicibacterium wolinskyi]